MPLVFLQIEFSFIHLIIFCLEFSNAYWQICLWNCVLLDLWEFLEFRVFYEFYKFLGSSRDFKLAKKHTNWAIFMILIKKKPISTSTIYYSIRKLIDQSWINNFTFQRLKYHRFLSWVLTFIQSFSFYIYFFHNWLQDLCDISASI